MAYIGQNVFQHPARELSDSACLQGGYYPSGLVMKTSTSAIAFAVGWLL
jgi:hypothetical protein